MASEPSPGDTLSPLFLPIRLPCGLIVQNRLVKAATYEHLSPLFGGSPTSKHCALYARWSLGLWGMIITGNVQVAADHLTLGRDVVLPRTLEPEDIAPFRALACSAHGLGTDNKDNGTLLIMQLSHAGRQSASVLGGRWPLQPASAPSAIPFGRRAGDSWFAHAVHRILFPVPRVLSVQEIDYIFDRFVHGARIALAAGFDGIELHAAHGYLLAEFLSPDSNIREDIYSVDKAPQTILWRIVTEIRRIVPSSFAIGVKISSDGFVGSGSTLSEDEEAEAEAQSLALVKEVAEWGELDFIEISGGSYENPEFILSSRQVFFSKFARMVREAVQEMPIARRPLILLTGGLHRVERLQSALSDGHADLLGLARAAALAPDLPRRLAAAPPGPLNNESGDPLIPPEPSLSYPDGLLTRLLCMLLYRLGILPLPKLIGAGINMAWYTVMLRRLASGKTADYRIGGLRAVVLVWEPELRVLAAMTLAALVVALWISSKWGV